MKKLSLLVLGFLFVFFSCSGNTGNNAQDEVNSLKPAEETNETVVKTTLDSLQGVWYLKSDNKGILKIAKDSAFNIYENEVVDKGEVLLGNECSEDIKTMNKRSGKYMILHSDVFMCYEIELIQANKLVLLYNNNRLEYQKK